MKIINAMFSKGNGGLEQSFLNYTHTLEKMGIETLSIIHPKASIKEKCQSYRFIEINNRNQYDPFAMLQLYRIVKAERPDCILVHGKRAAYLFKQLWLSVPKIIVSHGLQYYPFHADAIIALTLEMQTQIAQLGYAQKQIQILPNMISLMENPAFTHPKIAQVPIIGICTRLILNKGIETFIAALAELKGRQIPFIAYIAGEGEEKQRFVHLIKEHQLQLQVHILGWLDNTDEFYQTIDIFCHPSEEEAFGLVILDAMKHAKPCILTALAGPQEIIGESQAALFVPPKDPAAMADALEQIIRDPALMEKLSYNAFQRVQSFGTDKIGPRLKNLLQRVCTQYQRV